MYLFLKLIHLIGVVVFLGNISLGVFWKYTADKTADPGVIAHTMRSIVLADRLFTIPGIVVLIVGGIGTAMAGGIPILGTGWILWSIVLLVISGLAFAPLSRVQHQLIEAAQQAQSGGGLALYDRLSGQWNLWGTIALLAPLVAFGFMILKPALPALHG